MWQDIVLAIGNGVFLFGMVIIAIRPINELRPPLWTSIPTGFMLLIYGMVFWTLGLTFTCIASVMTGICWLITACQRIRQDQYER